MKSSAKRNLVRVLAAGALLATIAGGAQAADRRTTNTLIGAAIGAVGGALISNGDPLMTIGGAAAGGLIGNVATHDRGHRDYGNNHGNNRAWQRDDRAWQRDNRAWGDNRRDHDGRQVTYGRPYDDRYDRRYDDRRYDGNRYYGGDRNYDDRWGNQRRNW